MYKCKHQQPVTNTGILSSGVEEVQKWQPTDYLSNFNYGKFLICAFATISSSILVPFKMHYTIHFRTRR